MQREKGIWLEKICKAKNTEAGKRDSNGDAQGTNNEDLDWNFSKKMFVLSQVVYDEFHRTPEKHGQLLHNWKVY